MTTPGWTLEMEPRFNAHPKETVDRRELLVIVACTGCSRRMRKPDPGPLPCPWCGGEFRDEGKTHV